MIYLDFNATTRVDPRVRERLINTMDSMFANPSSVQHASGRAAQQVVEQARNQAAEALDSSPRSLIWTSGATESLSLALLGIVASQPRESRTVVLSPTEHKAVLAAAEVARRTLGAKVKYLDVDASGVVSCASLEESLDQTVCMVSVMHSNNETGVLNPVEEVSALCRGAQVPLLVDATQSLGKVNLESALAAADILALSSHKAYGPKGVGLLLAPGALKRRLVALQPGGGQEFGLRGGTQNVPGITAAALAVELAVREQLESEEHSRALCDRLMVTLEGTLSDIRIVTADAPRLSNTVNVHFKGADADAVMANAPDIAVATGSACNSANPEPSHVLLAMGLSRAEAEECIRFSVGKGTTAAEIDEASQAVVRAVSRVRHLTAA